MGDVPLEWYKDELHVGYDRDGRKVLRGPRRDRMDRLLAQADGGAGWRTVYDDYNGEEIVLSKEEFRMIQRIREGRFPHVEVTPPCVLSSCVSLLLLCCWYAVARCCGRCTCAAGLGCTSEP